MSEKPEPSALLVAAAATVPAAMDLQPAHRAALDAARAVFAAIPAPATTAIMAALLQSGDAVLNAHISRQKRLAALVKGEGPNNAESLQPALMGIGEALVANALTGDNAAIGMILNRLEGTPGLRGEEADAATVQTRAAVRASIESAVRLLTEQASGENAKVIDQEAE